VKVYESQTVGLRYAQSGGEIQIKKIERHRVCRIGKLVTGKEWF